MKGKNFFQYFLLAAAMTFCLAICFSPYFINYIKHYASNITLDFGEIFFIKSDWVLQHIPFYEEFFRLLDMKEIGWSWNQMFGIDFYAAKAYYLLGDPFAYLGYGLSKIILYLPNVLFYITLVKFYVAAFSFYYLLEQLGIKIKIRFAFAIMFAFSGWMTMFIEHPVFTSFYCLSPLLLAGTEKVLQENKYGLVMFSSAILLSINYYLTWMLCIFLLMYWIARYVILNERFEIRLFFIRSFKMLGAFLVGLLLSAVIWLPSLAHLLSNPRLAGVEIASYYLWDWKDVVTILKNFIIPGLRFNDFAYKNMWYYFNQIGIYCGLICLFLIPQYFGSSNISKKEKRVYGIFLVILMLTLVSPQIGKLFHFTYSLRYTLIIAMFMLILSALSISSIHNINKKVLIVSCVVLLLITVFVGLVFPYIQGMSSKVEINMIYGAIFLILLYGGLLFSSMKWDYKVILILLISIIEITCMSKQTMTSQTEDALYNAQYLIEGAEEIVKVNEKLSEYDPTFYRVILVDNQLNEGLYFDIPTVTTYDSVYQYSIYQFLDYLRKYPEVDWSFKIDDPVLYEMCNIKYVIGNGYESLKEYEYLGNDVFLDIESDYRIIKLNEETTFATTVNNFMNTSDFSEYTIEEEHYIFEAVDILSQKTIVEDSLYDEIQSKYARTEKTIQSVKYFSENEVIIDVNLTEDSFLFLSMAYDKGWKASIDGKEIELYSVSGGFVGAEVLSGEYELKLNYTVPMLDKAKILTGLGMVLSCAYLVIENKKKRN